MKICNLCGKSYTISNKKYCTRKCAGKAYSKSAAIRRFEIDLKTCEFISQWLQDIGYEEASKAIDCRFDL